MAAYGVLDDVKNLTITVGDKVASKLKSSLTDTDNSTTTATASKSDGQIVSDVKDIVLPPPARSCGASWMAASALPSGRA